MDASSPGTQLMESIRQKWGSTIQRMCLTSSVPEEFLAALIAGESGGDPTKSRFEPKVFAQLCAVACGKQAKFGSIGSVALIPTPGMISFRDGTARLLDFATSWGLTQIMGYQVIQFSRGVATLQEPTSNLNAAIILLTQFAAHNHLDLRSEFLELFACWNTGGPDPSKTTDPDYCTRGVMRAGIYSHLVAIAQSAPANAGVL